MNGEDIEQIDCFVAIATSDSADTNDFGGGMDVLVVHLQSKEIISLTQRSKVVGQAANLGYKSTSKLPLLHLIDITQIIALSDFEARLQFVTVSLDCGVKVIQIEESEEQLASV